MNSFSLLNQSRFHLFKEAVAARLLYDSASSNLDLKLSFWQKICHVSVWFLFGTWFVF